MVFPMAAAMAEQPSQGFSVFGGIASHSSNGEFTRGSPDGKSFSISSSGLSIGIDYQWPVAENVSVNVLFMGSNENASSKQVDIDSVGHGVYAVEGRYGFGDYFAGAHVGYYTEAVVSSKGDTSTSINGAGYGYGFTAGWAKPGRGPFVAVQYDHADIVYNNAKSTLVGTRLNAGYRWGL